MMEILVVAPIESILFQAEKLAKEDRFQNVQVVLGNMGEGARIAAQSAAQGAKVIISRGGTCHLIRQACSIPVVEIQVDAYDIVECCEKISEDADEIAVVGYNNVIYGFDFLKKMMKQRVTVIEIKDEKEIHGIIQNHKKTGIHTYVGDSNIIPITQKLGCKGVVIESREEAIYSALQEAERIIHATKEEKKRTQQLITMTDFIHDGVIAIDENQVVTLFNKRASELFSISREMAVGKPISVVIPSSRLPEALRNKRPLLSQLQKTGRFSLTTNSVPVLVEGEVKGAVATFQDVTEVQKLEQKIRLELHEKGFVARYRFEDILHTSKIMEKCVETARKYAAYDTPVHLYGSSGVGKELFCQSIHNVSPRKKSPFVAINCAAISPTLIESELFGYAEGSFTGANRKGKAGIFELAHKGTLFLDEISELPYALQGRLLRVLQEKQVMRVGGDKIIPVDVRIITASNRQLKDLVSQGRFRKDLFYRIHILTLRIPDLNERREDIPLLAAYFMKKYAANYNQPPLPLAGQTLETLLRYDYQGNVRELEGIIEKSVILSCFDDLEIPPEATAKPSGQKSASAAHGGILQQSERNLILDAMEKTGGNVQQAAQLLGISRTTLWRKLKKISGG